MAKRGRRAPIENKRSATEIDKEVGRRLRLHRIEKGLSQQELGVSLNVSFQQVQKYEKGTNRLTVTRLIEIARALDTTPHALVGWHDGKTITPLMDDESYKLLRAFCKLRDPLRLPVRTLINHLIDTQ